MKSLWSDSNAAAMIAVAVSSIATRQVVGHSFFTWQLERQGINLRGGRALGCAETDDVCAGDIDDGDDEDRRQEKEGQEKVSWRHGD